MLDQSQILSTSQIQILAFANLLADFITPKLRYCEAKAEEVRFELTWALRPQPFSRRCPYDHLGTPPKCARKGTYILNRMLYCFANYRNRCSDSAPQYPNLQELGVPGPTRTANLFLRRETFYPLNYRDKQAG